jgi:outer membrane murein-binding lipoprotein Lpp
MEEIIGDPEFKRDVEGMRQGLIDRENLWKIATMDGVDRRVTPNGQCIPASAPTKIRLHRIVNNQRRGSSTPTSTNSITDSPPQPLERLAGKEPEYNAPKTPPTDAIRTPIQLCLNASSSGATSSNADLSGSSETLNYTDVNASTEVSRLASDVMALSTDYAAMRSDVEAHVSTLTTDLEAIVERVARVEANVDTGNRQPAITPSRRETSLEDDVQDHRKVR